MTVIFTIWTDFLRVFGCSGSLVSPRSLLIHYQVDTIYLVSRMDTAGNLCRCDKIRREMRPRGSWLVARGAREKKMLKKLMPEKDTREQQNNT
jgi:hypothetical protein